MNRLNKKLKIILCAGIVLLLLCGVLFARGRKEDYPDPEDTAQIRINDSIPVDPQITKGKLGNGMAYYIRENHRPENRLILRLAVNAGSILENDDQQGLAHLAEHMAFNGTDNFAKHEIIDYLEGIGMRFGPEINAYTSFDETVYKLTIPTEDPEIVETGFKILSDWAFQISFEDEEVDKERGVVKEEWRLGRGAQARMRDVYFPVLFKDSRYAERLPIGKIEIIDNFEYSTLTDFYDDWYRPDLMAVIAVGDCPVEKIEALIKKYFGKEPAPKEKRERVMYLVPEHQEPLYSVVTDPEATNTVIELMIKHNPEVFATVDHYRGKVIRSLYNRMLNYRLAELSQQADPPFIYGVSTSADFVRTKSIYELAAIVPDGGVEKGLAALLSETKRIREFGFTSGELQRAKEEILGFYKRAYEERDKTESFALADEYIRNFLTDEVIPGIAYEYELVKRYSPGITLEEANSLAEELITDENRVIIVTGPEGSKMPSESDLSNLYRTASAIPVEPYEDALSGAELFTGDPGPGSIVGEETDRVYGIIELTLGNGMKVLLRPSDFKNREILISAFSPGGVSSVRDEDYVSAMMLPSIIGVSGIGDFSAVMLQKKLAGKQVSLTPTMGNISEGFSGSASPEDAEILFQLLHLYMTEARKDGDAFTSLKTRLSALVANRLSQPEAVYSDRLQSLVSGDHFRRRPLSAEVLQEMELDTALDVYNDRFTDPKDFTFFIAGSFSLSEIKPLIVKYLASLPAVSEKADSWEDEQILFPEDIIEEDVTVGIEPKSRVSLVFGGELDWDGDREHVFDSLLQVLDIRLREVIREDVSGTYGVGVAGALFPFPREAYRLQIHFGCEPERVEELTDLLFQELRDIKANFVDQEIIDKVREQQKRGVEQALKENGFWINVMKTSWIYGLPISEILDIERLAGLVTQESIRRMAEEVVNFDRYVLAKLFPEVPEGK